VRRGKAILKYEVPAPPLVVISTELLAQLIGDQKVIQFLDKGVIYPGQRRYHTTWPRTMVKGKLAGQTFASQAEYDSALALCNRDRADRPLTPEEECELDKITADLNRGLSSLKPTFEEER